MGRTDAGDEAGAGPMSRRGKVFAVLPTLLTLGNAACGFGAITFAAKVGPEPTEGADPLLISALLVFTAMIFDILDGSAARWAKRTSDFGAELDSLCDAISCGVAPAFLMLQFSMAYHGRLMWVIAALYVICTVMRLARFNVETEEDDTHEFFSGLPSPGAAGVVASFPVAQHGLEELLEPGVDVTAQQVAQWLIPAMKVSLPFVTLIVACLMVSRIRYNHVFNQLFHGHRGRHHMIQMVFTVAVVYMVREMAVPLIFGYYAFAAPVRAFWMKVIARRLHKSQRI